MTARSTAGVLYADAATVARATEELLRAAAHGQAGVRAAVVDPPALVLGSAQPEAGVDRAACEVAGVDVTRRGSGGGAVLCDGGLLQVDVALPPGHRLQGADVAESYRPLGEAWTAVLASLGVTCRLVTVAEARAADAACRSLARQACWVGLSPYEVLGPHGGKLVGLAQRRRGGAALVQCGLLCSGRAGRVLDLLRLSDEDRRAGGRSLADVVALDELAGPPWTDPHAVWERLGPALVTAVG